MRSHREPLLSALAGLLVGIFATLSVIEFQTTFGKVKTAFPWERYGILTALLLLAVAAIAAYLKLAGSSAPESDAGAPEPEESGAEERPAGEIERADRRRPRDAESLGKLAPDILMECTGAPAVIKDCFDATAAAGIVCLTGVTDEGKTFDVDVGRINRTMVLDNDCVFGSVNANRRHYEMAAQALAHADKSWLARLITRRVPLERWSEALEHRPGDIKVIVDFTQ